MTTCWLNRTGEPMPEGVEPDFVLTDFRQLPQLVTTP
jgi:FMN phosphatase YigB (HAD superfamily)